VTPSSPWGDERRQLLHQVQMRYQTLGRRGARRLCHRFERVGVHTAPERLRAMLAGVPVADAEVTDVNFALIAMQLNREARGAKFKRLKRQGTRSLLFAGLVLVVLNFLFCVAYLLLNLTQEATPYCVSVRRSTLLIARPVSWPRHRIGNARDAISLKSIRRRA